MRCALWMLVLAFALPCAYAVDYRTADTPRVVRDAMLDSDAPDRKQRAARAHAEMHRREAESLRYLLSIAHLRNYLIPIYVTQMWQRVPREESVPILLEAMKAPEWRTRKIAAYYLGFGHTPEHAPVMLTALQDDKVASTAIRTLGKWHVTNAIPEIARFVGSTNESQRVRAVVAMKDIGSPDAIPHLLTALRDPVLTVRFKAAEALGSLAPASTEAVTHALKTADANHTRALVRALSESGDLAARPVLETLLKHADWRIRGDAIRALREIDPDSSPDVAPDSAEHPYVQSGLHPRATRQEPQ